MCVCFFTAATSEWMRAAALAIPAANAQAVAWAATYRTTTAR